MDSPALQMQHSVILWNLWRNSLRGSTSLTSIQIVCHILLPCPFVQNVISSSVAGSDYLPKFHRYPFSICGKRNKCQCNGMTGHSENIIVSTAHKLAEAKKLSTWIQLHRNSTSDLLASISTIIKRLTLH